MLSIVVATNNVHKVDEIQSALHLDGVRFVPVSAVMPGWESPIEDADTFEGNASIKANAVHKACGLPALADDSGLVVDALGGAPGIYSSRYGGVEGDACANNAKLLAELAGVGDGARGARFVATLVLVGLDAHLEGAPAYLTVTGSVKGSIAHTLKGEGGFGYDPLFLPDEAPGKTMAQLTSHEKNAISHRGKALRALAKRYSDILHI